MKSYIGNILETKGGIVRVLNTKHCLVPHVLGGINNTKEDLEFISYEESEVDPEFMKKNDLKFLSKEEMAHFLNSENMKGEKIKKPEAPKRLSDEEIADIIEDLEKFLEKADPEKDADCIKVAKELIEKYKRM